MYVQDFDKLFNFMKETYADYRSFLFKLGMEDPCSEVAYGIIIDRLLKCTNDNDYNDIIKDFINRFRNSHFQVQDNQDVSRKIYPIIIRYVEDGYYIAFDIDKNNVGKRVFSINDIPVNEYVKTREGITVNDKGEVVNLEFQIPYVSNMLTIQTLDGNIYYNQPYSQEQLLPFLDKTLPMFQDKHLDDISEGHIEHLISDQGISLGDNIMVKCENGVLCIRIKSFKNKYLEADSQILQCLSDYTKENQIEDVVFDIRGNSGGTDEYFSLISRFSSSGMEVCEKYRSLTNLSEEEVNSQNGPVSFDQIYPQSSQIKSNARYDGDPESSVVRRYVLVDGYNFSAADKFAKAVKASNFATLIGTVTSGDGIGYTPLSLQTDIQKKSGYSIRMDSSCGNYEEYFTYPDIYLPQTGVISSLEYWTEKDTQLSQSLSIAKIAKIDAEKTELNQLLSQVKIQSSYGSMDNNTVGKSLGFVTISLLMGLLLVLLGALLSICYILNLIISFDFL